MNITISFTTVIFKFGSMSCVLIKICLVLVEFVLIFLKNLM